MSDFLKLGTTTLEAKSGYGLDLDSELKSLAILDEVNSEHRIDIIPTFMGAHAVPKEYDNKLVYLMGVDKARFRNPVLPDCELHLEIEAIRSHGKVWKYKGIAKVNEKRMADAEWSATIVDRKE